MINRALIPVSLIVLVTYLNYDPSPSSKYPNSTIIPTLDNCVPEQGVSRHLCPNCKDDKDAAIFSKDRDYSTGLNTVFVQGRIGDWWLVDKDMKLNTDSSIRMTKVFPIYLNIKLYIRNHTGL